MKGGERQLGLAAGVVVFTVVVAASLGCAHEEAYVALRPVADITVSAGARHYLRRTRVWRGGLLGGGSDGQTDAPSGSFRSVSAGWAHTCALRASGEIYCWGAERPPDSDDDDDGIPVDQGQAAAPAGKFLAVSAGEYHSCALRESGEVACWGWFGKPYVPPGNPDGRVPLRECGC